MISRNRSPSLVFVFATLLVAVVMPAHAQREWEPLFDTFNLKLEGSWIGLKTQVRLDSEVLGAGTTLSFEDDLGLSNSDAIPTIAFSWQIARRHRMGVRWQDISRDSSVHALTEIRWGDEIIAVNAAITLGFDITQYFIDYAYYPWVNERWAAGFGLGLRVMDVLAPLRRAPAPQPRSRCVSSVGQTRPAARYRQAVPSPWPTTPAEHPRAGSEHDSRPQRAQLYPGFEMVSAGWLKGTSCPQTSAGDSTFD